MNILILATDFKLNIKYSLEQVGSNMGNLCFPLGLKNIIKHHNIFFTDTIDNIKPDLLLLTTANCITNIKSCSNYIGYLSDQLKKYDCRKIIISIGAQNDNFEMFNLNHETKKNIISLFSQCETIFLRGEYTKNLLKHNNINSNYHPNGCPSIALIDELKVNETVNLTKKSKIIFNLFRKNQCNIDNLKSILEFPIGFLQQDMCGFKILYKNYSYNDWLLKLKDYDFCIGTRIHGAIMSLVANIPTLLIVIDSRTKELADILNIPYYDNLTGTLKFSNLDEIINFINANYKFNIKDFQTNKKRLLSNYLKHIDKFN